MEKSTDRKSAMLTDEQIVELYWHRDENAICETEAKYGKLLFHIAYNILHDRLDCEECKNDTYLGIWNTIPPTRPTTFSAFISRIIRNIATDKYKEKMSQKRVPSELTVSIDELQEFLHEDDTPATEYSAKELGKIISDYVKQLSDRRQYIFIERYYLCSTVDSIARELGIGLATVHRETEKIKQGLKTHLEQNGVYL